MDPTHGCHPPRARRGIVALTLAVPLLLAGCLPASDADSDPVDVTAPPISVPTTDATESDDLEQDEDMGEDPGTMEDSPSTGGTATLSMAGESFSFTPTMCAISDADVLVDAPGQSNEEGILAFLSVDVTEHDGGPYGGVRVERGTDQPFDSTDDFYAADIGADHPGSMLTVQGNAFVFEGEFHTGAGVPVGPGTLTVDCDAAPGTVDVDPPTDVDDAEARIQAEDCGWEAPALTSPSTDVPDGQDGDLQTVIIGAWQHTHYDSGAGYVQLDEEDIRFIFPSSTTLMYCQHIPGVTEHASNAAAFAWEGNKIMLPASNYDVSLWNDNTMVWVNSVDGSLYLLQRRA